MDNRAVRRSGADREALLTAAIAGGFGAVFGVPAAGVVFALEVPGRRRWRRHAWLPALAASVTGDVVVRAVGVGHAHVARLPPLDLTWALVAQLLAAGAAFGLAAVAFVIAVESVRGTMTRWIAWPPARPFVGGVVVVGLTYAVGTRDYLGLSLPVAATALAGSAGVAAFVWKLVFSSVSLGSGFYGGEVTPLFVIGATLGVTMAELVGGDPTLFAALGYVTVFGAAASTPIACVVLGVELFGPDAIVPMLITGAVAYSLSRERTIYHTQLDIPITGDSRPTDV